MMTAEQRDALSEIITGARDEFDQAWQDAHQDHTVACQEQMENLAFAAEMAEINGLTLICQEMSQQLVNVTDRTEWQALVGWTDAVLAFIRNPQDEQLAQQVVRCLPEESRPLYLQLLLHPGAGITAENDDFELEPLQDNLVQIADLQSQQDFSPPSPSQPQPNDLQQLLINELQNMAQELGKILDELFAAVYDNALETLKDRYINIVQCLLDTAQLTELQGLAKLCEHIIYNTALLNRRWLQDHRGAAYLVMRQWPMLVLDYLQAPANDEQCIALINHLELEGWPQPIVEDSARQLLDLLLATGNVQQEDEPVVPRHADPADMDLTLPADLNQDLLDAFLHDAPTQAAELSACMNALQGDASDAPVIAQAQRITHTMKGAANIVGIKAVANMAHAMEDLFERLQAQSCELPTPLHVLLQACADCVEAMVNTLQGKEEAPDERFMLYQQLIDHLNDHADATPTETAITPTVEPQFNRRQDDEPAIASPSVESVRVPLQVISSLFQLAEEITIALGSTQEQTQRILKKLRDAAAQDKRIQEHRFELENAVDVRAAAHRQRRLNESQQSAEFDSLEMDHYDEVYDVAHALIESVADSREVNREIAEQVRSLDALLVQQSRLNKELQRLVKHTRLVPAQSLMPRLQRCIRHATRITGKLVNFSVTGTDTEINEDVLDKLIDPIMHLLRNAVDHGIEPAQERINAGKASQGDIQLIFAQDGQHILINCDDDGAGINAEKVRARAIERGLINPGDSLSQQQIHQLLMAPGFTTKDTINQVSGRGIGMDAVYKRIRELGGTLQIHPRITGGTRFEIRVPLQLVASHALLVQIQQQLFAIPTRQLNQILPPGSNPIDFVGELPALSHDNQIYPAHHLGKMLGLPQRTESPQQWNQFPMLLTHSAQEAAAICVDAVVANQDLVIKSTGDYVKNVPGIAGVAILGDGRLVPVLDLPALLERRHPLATTALQFGISTGEEINRDEATVLIVDDSLSVRKSLTQLVGDAGYHTDTARDGLDAWEKIVQQPPALILVDMEMPRMNGIELTNRLRNHDSTRQIPVLMITSRSTQKHRNAAEKAGVTDYFTKPFTEGDLLNRIHHFLQQADSHGNAA